MVKSVLHGGAWIAMVALTSILGGCSSEEEHHHGSSGYGDSGKTAAKDAATVELSADQFVPPEVTIKAGESVLWKNTSSESHSVTADPAKVANKQSVSLPTGAKPFTSGEIKPGKSWRMTFTMPGTYKYVCTIHEEHGMTGRVVVRSAEPMSH